MAPVSRRAGRAGSYYEGIGTPRTVRTLMRATQAVWPALAAHAAALMFCTPGAPRWLRPRPRWAAGLAAERWHFERASLTVYRADGVVALNSNRPVVLLVHGWGGHAGQMLPMAQALQAAGWHAVLLDMPAHGRSRGISSSLPQFARAIDYATARLQQDGRAPSALVAHSLGANAAAFAASRGLPISRLVLLAPPASPTMFTRQFAQMFGLHEPTRLTMQRRIEAREAALMRDFEPAHVGPRVGSATLVVHDEDDRINGFADGAAFADAIPCARLHATRGLGHRRLLQTPEVLATVVGFLAATD